MVPSGTFTKHLAPISELLSLTQGFPSGLDSKELACNVGDQGLIPGLGRSPGEGNGYALQYSGLENPMDRAGYSPWSLKELDTTEGT